MKDGNDHDDSNGRPGTAIPEDVLMAVEEVDYSLLALWRKLSIRERLRACSSTQRLVWRLTSGKARPD